MYISGISEKKYYDVTGDLNLSESEKEHIQEIFYEVNLECKMRHGLPYIHANSLYWTGERFIRFTMINGHAVVAERFIPVTQDEFFKSEWKYKNSSILF